MNEHTVDGLNEAKANTATDEGEHTKLKKTSHLLIPQSRRPIRHLQLANINPSSIRGITKNSKTHRVCPLSAYSTRNNKIHPSSYRTKLQGAIVEIQFTIAHVAIGNKDIFGADIVNINVLESPHHLPTPSKRRRSQPHPETSKRAKFNEDSEPEQSPKPL